MPESWVRGALLVRLNSLSRGHSGVRTEVLEKMAALLKHNITPVIPVRGSISASGDLSTLSYVAGCLAGQDGIYAIVTDPNGHRLKVPSSQALKQHGIEPVSYGPKEALGILNGTAPNAAVASLDTTLAAELQALQAAGLYRRRGCLQSAQAARVLVAGRPYVSFASNDYLGLASRHRKSLKP